MLKVTVHAKGSNVQTSAFKEYLSYEAKKSKYLLRIEISASNSDELKIVLTGYSSRVNAFISWLKSASKGVSRVKSVRTVSTVGVR